MAKTKTEYDLLISCPGDVAPVVKLINSVVKKFNDSYSDILSIRLNAKHWSNSSYNQSGGKAQALLNKQFIHDCDAAIAIFWTRFGAPTDRYGSSTEEEIEDMLAAGKQVFLYFCAKPVDPELLLSEKTREQYQKVKDYQKKYADKGIYSSYSSDKEFKEKLFAHLSMHFLSMKKVEEISSRRTSSLSVKGIKEGKLDSDFYVSKYSPDGIRSSDIWIEEIKSLYEEISNIPITKSLLIPEARISFDFRKTAELPKGVEAWIRGMAEKLDLALAENFFDLGDLKEDGATIPAVMGGSHRLYGTEQEKEKYNKLIRLFHEIDDLCGWLPFDKAFKELSCVKLAVSNDGTAFDEDIDITLRFLKADIIKPNNLPMLTEHGCQRILDDYSLEELMGIPATQHYNDFESSKKRTVNAFQAPTTAGSVDWMLRGRDYEEEYLETLAEVFDYAFFDDGDHVVVKLHIDYLKHNTTVAFPTVLFVSDGLETIEYTIRSKQNEKETVGVIKAGGKNET